VRTILFAVLVGAAAVFANAQTAEAPKLNFLADSVDPVGDKLQLHGHVRIATCAIVTADEAVYDGRANEFDLNGPAHMKLTHGVDRLSVTK
jgi:hypothetical protein